MYFSKAISFIGLLLLVGGCGTVTSTQGAKELLLNTDREWSQIASESRDVQRIAAFWADDAEVLPPGAPVVRGKAAIREFVQQSLAIPGFRISWRPDSASVSADGTLGYTTGVNSLTLPGNDGKLTAIEGRYATVWRRSTDGSWKCVVDIWNSGRAGGA